MAQSPNSPISPVVLVILDGWGYREEKEGNAVAAANVPVMNSLWNAYPHTLIQTSGKAVGLPEGQMGNSEVGHLNIGAGRVVPQELVRISDAVEERTLGQAEAMRQVAADVKRRGGKLHLVGLCSNGGVHSHIDHLIGLLNWAKAEGIEQVCIHAITDGRDTKPTAALEAIATLEEQIKAIGIGEIVTIGGRYYAMDRDHRWDRVQKFYDVMTLDGEGEGHTALEVLKASYEQKVTDEFIEPTRLAPGAVADKDGVIFFNFRPDRARQLTQAFVDPDFKGFPVVPLKPLTFVTFTQYDASLEDKVLVVFKPQNLDNILGEVIANHGLQQFRTAETEKYAHVTYFFNGGIEEPFPGEERAMIPSPMVATYDKAPEMSAVDVTDGAIAAIQKGIYSLIVINYANPDMVGHTGNMDATVRALETVDICLGRLLQSVSQAGGSTIIIADHGNAEYMWDDSHNPWTAHTTNDVPFILVEGERRKLPGYGCEPSLREDGKLADVAPTILQLLGLPQPPEMTGRSMFEPATIDVKANRSPVRLAK
jgi:2,3-bisphosphoglycerate-independent phosphoglycerate mutase